MNREALYYKDIKEFDATVLSCENALYLIQRAFIRKVEVS